MMMRHSNTTTNKHDGNGERSDAIGIKGKVPIITSPCKRAVL